MSDVCGHMADDGIVVCQCTLRLELACISFVALNYSLWSGGTAKKTAISAIYGKQQNSLMFQNRFSFVAYFNLKNNIK